MSVSTQMQPQSNPIPWDDTSSGTSLGTPGEAPLTASASSAVTGVHIRGGRFNNSANANNNFSLSLFNLILGPGDCTAPSGTQSEFPSVVYSRLLLPKACGFPLYNPRPPPWLNDEYTKEGVGIGDVGIVTTEGSFDFLFNIRYAPDHPINRGGVPPCFLPPEWASCVVSPPQDGRDPGGYVANGSIQVLESDQANGDYRFMGNAGEGAALVIPTSTITAQIPNTRQFRDYAAENAFNWYKFAERLGRDAPNGSMYLVTGWEKTRMWGTASFEENKHDFELAYGNGTWSRYGLATTKRGPRSVDAESPEPFNQCIFLSGYKMTLGESLWQRLLGTVEVSGVGNTAQQTSVMRRPFFTRALLGRSLARWTYPSEGARLKDSEQSRQGTDQLESGDVVLESIDSSTLLDVHPSNLINRFLLSKVPSAEVAITHDRVWCSLINNAHAPFEDQLTAMYAITVQSGVVYLTERSAKNGPKTSSEESSTSAGNSLHELPSPTSTTRNPPLESGAVPTMEPSGEEAVKFSGSLEQQLRMATISSSFGPGLHAKPHDLIFLTTDYVLFYLHLNVLSRLSTNAFRTVIEKPSISVAGCDEPVKHIWETSDILEVILRALYRMPYRQMPKNFEVVANAIGSMRTYDIEPTLHLIPTNPFYSSMMEYATSAPLDLYALAAQYKLEHLATSASPQLLSITHAEIADEVLTEIDPIYLKRLADLQEERLSSLTRILTLGPASHTPTPECGATDQTKLDSAWVMMATGLVWGARQDFSATNIRSSFGSLRGMITCPLCLHAFDDRLEGAITDWNAVKASI